MLQVDVPVPLIQGTTVHEIPEVQVAERPPLVSEDPVATLAAQESVTKLLPRSRRAQLLRFRDGEWEES